MSQWIFEKLAPYAIRFREWSKDKLWAKIPLWILIAWMLGVFNPYGVSILFVGFSKYVWYI